MKRRGFLFFLALVLALTIVLAGCEEDKDIDTELDGLEEEPEDVEENETASIPTEPSGQIIIGNTTELSGDWVPYWQKNAADYDVYNFMSGASIVEMNPEGEYFVNETVVEDYEKEENEDGTKTYTWTIKDGMMYDNGAPITAKDYVTTVLLWSSNLVGEMGGDNTLGHKLVGWDEFSKGEKKEFTGVRLINESTFSVTLLGDEVPYFYELLYVGFGPTHLEFWTDEVTDILDDGDGAYFTENFTKDAFEDHINGQRQETFPATGPYSLKSYDEGTNIVVLEVNENFVGNYKGTKPLIQTIIYKKVTDEIALDELDSGSVDLLSGLSSGNEIQAGLDLVNEGSRFDFLKYPRSGYEKLTLIGDFGPTQFVEVRQALAHLIDRNDFVKTFTGGFGTVVNGPYGESMWFYQETKDELYEKLDQYVYSFESAKKLLEDGGWIFDAEGNKYSGEGVRYKKVEDGQLMPLVIEWASTGDNEVSELLALEVQENPDLTKVGMEINQTTMPFIELLNYLYRDDSVNPKYGVPTFHMYNLVANYGPKYDLSKEYTTNEEMLKKGYNDNFLIDEELEQLAIDMVELEPDQQVEFKEVFVDFILRWNELMPDIPLYSDIYYDFYNKKLKNYENNSFLRIDEALLPAYVEGD